jgi:hypothetical protein
MVGRASSYTRRSFVKRTGLAGGALWLVATGWEKTIGRAVAALAPDTVERSRRTYVALVDAASASPKCHLRGGSAAQLEARFDAWYTKQDDRLQRITDSILADVDATFDGGAFHRATRDRRLGHIRALANPPLPAASGPSAEWRIGAWRKEQIARYANDPAYSSDPTDISTIKAAPLDRSEPPPKYPKVDVATVARQTLMSQALTLAAAPDFLDPDDPDGLMKVPSVAV